MRVKLIQVTQNPIDVMWVAARTCYSAKSPIEMWDDLDSYYSVVDELSKMEDIELITDKKEQTDKHWNLVKKVLDSGHQSVAEHVYFTFAIEGISRACSHQLVRHRAGIVFSQQSQRYVEIKENEDYISNILWHGYRFKNPSEFPETFYEVKKQECREVAEKYFTHVKDYNIDEYLQCLVYYLRAIKDGVKPEDARNVLPNATKTNITMSLNYRELIHICNLRLCTRAQKEIRDLFALIVKEVKNVDERLASYLVPQCDVHGVCFENQCCGRKPRLEDIKK